MISAGAGTPAPRLKSPPSPLIWKALLAIGVLARAAADGQASDARALSDDARTQAEAEAIRVAAEEGRRGDSVRLTIAVDSGVALSAERAWQLESALHAGTLTIPHDAIHRRVVTLQLDSTADVVKRATKNLTYATAARQLLTEVQAPLTAVQARRQAELSSQLGRIDRRMMLQAQRQEARARAQAETPQPSRQQAEIQPSRTRVPPGASARCRDGSYSFSGSRSGTCSRRGGVSEWL